MSGPSIRPTSFSNKRLIMFLVVVGRHELGFLLRDLAEEVVVEYLARDRRSRGAAVAAVLDEDRHRELRVVRGRVRDEERMVAKTLLHAFLVVGLALLQPD